MKIIRSKIMPITNPNYQLKETPQKLIEILLKSNNIFVLGRDINGAKQVLGIIYTSNNNFTLENDNFIYGDIVYSSIYSKDFEDYQWSNCGYEVDKDMNITRFVCVQYERME